MKDKTLHLIEDLLAGGLAVLLGIYLCACWAEAAWEPTKGELVEAYYGEGLRVPGESSEIRVQRSEETRTYLGSYYVTGYDTCAACCGKSDGITASGTTATVGRTCAANGLPFGTRLYIEGIGERTVEDRGGMKGRHIDVLCADHPDCYAVTGWYEVWEVG